MNHKTLLNAILAQWNIMDDDVVTFKGRKAAKNECIRHIECDAGTFEILSISMLSDDPLSFGWEYDIIDWVWTPKEEG